MTVNTTYDTVLSRIRITATSLGASATYAVVDRTTNGINYTTVRGGTAATVTSQNLGSTLDDYEFPEGVSITYRIRSYNTSNVLQSTQTDTISATMSGVWLKFIARPYLNRQVEVLEVGSIARASRNGIFPVIGRSNPITVTDLHGSREVTLSVKTTTATQARNLDLALANGSPVFVHAPTDFFLESMYAVVGNFEQSILVPVTPFNVRKFDIPLTETSAPSANIVGYPGTWTILLNNYATWSTVATEFATWADVAELIGDPSDIIVGD